MRDILILKYMSEVPIFIRRDPHSSKNHNNREKSRKIWEKSHLHSIFMLHDCVYERLTLEVVLRYGSCKLIKIPSFGCKVPLWCVLTEKRQPR